MKGGPQMPVKWFRLLSLGNGEHSSFVQGNDMILMFHEDLLTFDTFLEMLKCISAQLSAYR